MTCPTYKGHGSTMYKTETFTTLKPEKVLRVELGKKLSYTTKKALKKAEKKGDLVSVDFTDESISCFARITGVFPPAVKLLEPEIDYYTSKDDRKFIQYIDFLSEHTKYR